MIEIKPWIVAEERFLGILIYLPKCTMRMLVNMKIICLDDSFDIRQIEKRCTVPLIACRASSFEEMMKQKCTVISHSAEQLGINQTMNMKEAIQCAFRKDKY